MADAPTPQRPDEAIAYIRARLAGRMSPDDIEALVARIRNKSLTIAQAAMLSLTSDTWTKLEAAERAGIPYDEAKAQHAEALRAAYVGNATRPATKVDSIVKNLSNDALAVGRKLNVAVRGDGDINAYTHQRFDAVMDDRVSEICEACNGTILPINDPWWKSHQPPLHHNCRSIVTPLTRAEAEAMGITAAPPRVAPTDGFGDTESLMSWTPQPADYPTQVYKIYSERFGASEP